MSRPKAPERQSTLRPSWLLRHAEQLIERITDTELPRTAHPRRAVSAAYYALFHRVCLDVAYTAAPQADSSAWWQLCRGFEHGGVASVSEWLRGAPCPTSVAALVDSARRSTDLVNFAWLFILLREERELADYSHEVVVDRRGAHTVIGHARTAMDALNAVGYGDERWQAFVALMLMKAKPRTYQLPTSSP